MIDWLTCAPKGCGDAAIAVAPSMFVIDAADAVFQISMLVSQQCFALVVEGAARQPRSTEQQNKWICLPQSLDGLRFLGCAVRGSAWIKASSFFR
ncbi:hypothetical protein D3C71_1311700 [compost metagenome]